MSAVVAGCAFRPEPSAAWSRGQSEALREPQGRARRRLPGKAVPVLEPLRTLLKKHLCLCFRIAGDTALNKNIHESVSAQIRKNFAKSKWRVSVMSIRSP